MIIYLDIFFLKNVIFNYLLIYLTSLVIRKKVKAFKILFAATVGGTYAILALCFQEVFNSVSLKIIVGIIMLLIVFGIKEVTLIFSSFFVLAYFVAGIIASILSVNSKIILALLAILTTIIFYIYKKNQKQNEYYDMKIKILQYEFELNAKLDTGNELKDAIFGDSVIIVSEEKINNKVENELIKVLNNEKLEIPDKYKEKIKLISFKTISEEGISVGIKLDKLIIYIEDKKVENKAIMILTKRNFKHYDALIGKDLLEGGCEYENNSSNKIKN